MSTFKTPASTPFFYFNGYRIDSSYSFSAYGDESAKSKKHKVWLDMIYMDPIKEEAVTVRVAKHALILCQPKEVIEVIAQREIKDFLSYSGFSSKKSTSRKRKAATA